MERIAELEAHDAPPWLPELCAALGWSGGTIHQALAAVRRLVEAPGESEGARHARQVQLDEVALALGPARMEAAGGVHYEAVAQLVHERDHHARASVAAMQRRTESARGDGSGEEPGA